MAVSLTIPRRGLGYLGIAMAFRGNETTLLFEFVLSMTSIRLINLSGQAVGKLRVEICGCILSLAALDVSKLPRMKANTGAMPRGRFFSEEVG